MARTAYFAGTLLAAVLAASPSVAVTATTSAHVTILEGNVVRMNWSIAMPGVRGDSGGAGFSGTQPSMMMGMMMLPGNANLTVRRDDGSGVPVTAPTSFEVVRNEGDNALVIKTAANAEVWIASDGAIMGGSLQGTSAASIAVGRGLAQAGAMPNLNAPSSTLVIVVQYN